MKELIAFIKNVKFRLTADFIVYTIALSNAARLGWVYAYADANGNVFSLPGLSGVLIGLSVSIAVAFVSGKISKVTGPRKAFSWVALILVMILEPLVISPVTRVGMPVELVNVAGWYSWPWSVFTALLPSVVLAAVSFVNGEGMIQSVKEKKGNSESSGADSEISGAKTAVTPLKCPVCGTSENKRGEPILTTNALNGHMREHNKKAG